MKLSKSSVLCLTICLISLFILNIPAGVGASESVLPNDLEGLSTLQGVVFQQIGDSSVLMNVKGSEMPAPIVVSSTSSSLVIKWENSYIPSISWSRGYTSPLISKICLDQESSDLVMTITVNKKLDLVKVTGVAPANSFMLELHTSDRVAKENLQLKKDRVSLKPYTTNDPFSKNIPVNLDLRDVELRDVFRMFGDIINMNIIADPSVPDAYVTMTLKGVPLSEAFGYLMKMYDVTYSIMGRTIIVGKADNLGKTLGREKTMSYHIGYADPKTVGGLLQGLAGVNQVVVDERLRTIYVTARDDQFIKVSKVLKRIDHPGKQVMLKARIIEVTDTGKKDLESILAGVYKNWFLNYSSGGLAFGGVSVNEDGSAAYDPDNDRATSPVNVDLEDIAGSSIKLLDAGINMLVTENKGNVLADPSVITVDGGTATIKLVENYKYISERDDAGNPTYDEEQVGPQLECTPTIGRDGIITVELSVQTGEIIGTYSGSQGEEFPQTSTREVETVVRVRNGEPFVIGGLDKESDTTEQTKLPILGDIPILGELFKNTSHTNTKTEVAIIVIPYILETPDGPLEELQL